MKKVFAILAIMVVLIAGCTSTNSAEEMIGIRGDITSIYIDNEGSTINAVTKTVIIFLLNIINSSLITIHSLQNCNESLYLIYITIL